MEPKEYPLGLKIAAIVVAGTLMTGFVLMRGRNGAQVPVRDRSGTPLDTPETQQATKTVHVDSIHFGTLPSSKSGIVFPVEGSDEKQDHPKLPADSASSPKATNSSERRMLLSSSKSMAPLVPSELITSDSTAPSTTDTVPR